MKIVMCPWCGSLTQIFGVIGAYGFEWFCGSCMGDISKEATR